MLKVEHKKVPGTAIRSKYISLKKIDLVIAGPQCSFKWSNWLLCAVRPSAGDQSIDRSID